MFKALPLFIAVLFVFCFASHVEAQSADDPSGGSGVPSEVPAQGEAPTGEPTPESSTSGARPTPTAESAGAEAVPVAPISAPIETSTGTPIPAANEAAPSFVIPPESTGIMPTPPPSSEEVPIVLTEEASGPSTSNFPFLATAGAFVILLGGGIWFLRGSSNKNNKSDKKNEDSSCNDLKERYEEKKAEYEQSIKDISVQELLVGGLEKKIENMKGEVEGEAKKAIKKTGHKIKDEVIKKEATGTLKEAVAIVEEAKEAYDDLKRKYEKAQKWLESLKNLKAGLSKEMDERETAYNICIQGDLATSVIKGGGLTIDLPEASTNEKIIFVGVSTYMAAHQLLDKYSNKKVILTRALGEENKNVATKGMPYEIFVLRRDPQKTDQERYEVMLKHLGFIKEDKAKSSRDTGPQNLKELKKFLEENL